MADYTPGEGISVFNSGLKLIAQPKDNLCWWAAALMMWNWKLGRGGNPPDPFNDPVITKAVEENLKLGFDQTVTLARRMGMQVRTVNSTPNVKTLGQWLSMGPLFTNGIYVDWTGKGGDAGSGHVTVLAGVRSVPSSVEYEVYVYDPWFPNVGHEGWRPITHLGGIMDAGADPSRDARFLYY